MHIRFMEKLLSGLVLGVIAFAGCGKSDKSIVSGKVTLDGKPIEDGDISFFPEQGTAGAQSSTPIVNGEYRLADEWGLNPGTYQVRINAYREPTDKSNMLAGGFLDKPPVAPGTKAREQFLPAQFTTGSALEKLVVETGQTTVEKNFDLKLPQK